MALRTPKVTQTTAPVQEEQNSQSQAQEEQVKTGVVETVAEQAAADAANAAEPDSASDDADGGEDLTHEEQVQQQTSQVHQDYEASVVAEQAQESAGGVVAEQVQSKDVALASEGGAAVVKAGTGSVMKAFTQTMAEEGFEGLNISGMSFDRIKLSEGNFVLGTDEYKLGESFDCVLMSTRPIFIVRQYDDDDAEIFFSYDEKGEFLTDGSSSAEILEKWKEDGYGNEDSPLDIKRYLEGMAQLVNREDEYEGHMVSLSIPPASTDRLGGATVVGFRKFKVKPDNLVITCKVGAKITKGSISWRPWVFVAKGVYQAA